jgi:DNA modification methylase
MIAAIRTGRNSIGNEIEEQYLKLARTKVAAEAAASRPIGIPAATVL